MWFLQSFGDCFEIALGMEKDQLFGLVLRGAMLLEVCAFIENEVDAG